MAGLIRPELMTDDDERRLWLASVYVFVRSKNPLFCAEFEDARTNPHDIEKQNQFRKRWGIEPVFENSLGDHLFPDIVEELSCKNNEEFEDARANLRDLEKRIQQFKTRWGIDPVFENLVEDQDREEDDPHHLLKISIDLRYHKDTIMKKIEKIVDYNQKTIRKHTVTINYGTFGDDINVGSEFSPLNMKKGNIKKDPWYYKDAIAVWNMKKNGGKSWQEISEIMAIRVKTPPSKQTLDNWYKVVEKLIREGVPGFPPFPIEAADGQLESTMHK
jgi:hypothetical protein